MTRAFASFQRAHDATELPEWDACEDGMTRCEACGGRGVDPRAGRRATYHEDDACEACSGDGVVPCACEECSPRGQEDDMEQTERAELAQTMTVMGREYTLVDAEESPPRWWSYTPEHSITLWGYPDLWRAHATVSDAGTQLTLFGNGPTPEAALEALTVAYGAIDGQRVRMLGLIEGALGTAPGAEAAQ